MTAAAAGVRGCWLWRSLLPALAAALPPSRRSLTAAAQPWRSYKQSQGGVPPPGECGGSHSRTVSQCGAEMVMCGGARGAAHALLAGGAALPPERPLLCRQLPRRALQRSRRCRVIRWALMVEQRAIVPSCLVVWPCGSAASAAACNRRQALSGGCAGAAAVQPPARHAGPQPARAPAASCRPAPPTAPAAACRRRRRRRWQGRASRRSCSLGGAGSRGCTCVRTTAVPALAAVVPDSCKQRKPALGARGQEVALVGRHLSLKVAQREVGLGAAALPWRAGRGARRLGGGWAAVGRRLGASGEAAKWSSRQQQQGRAFSMIRARSYWRAASASLSNTPNDTWRARAGGTCRRQAVSGWRGGWLAGSPRPSRPAPPPSQLGPAPTFLRPWKQPMRASQRPSCPLTPRYLERPRAKAELRRRT